MGACSYQRRREAEARSKLQDPDLSDSRDMFVLCGADYKCRIQEALWVNASAITCARNVFEFESVPSRGHYRVQLLPLQI